MVHDDLLDGTVANVTIPGGGGRVLTPNDDSYNFRIGLNINLGSKSVQPLWWINPLDMRIVS